MLESSFQQHTIADNDYSRVTTTGEDFQDESIQDEDSSMMGVIFNALNLISGSSLVGLPYALKESGLILGLFFFIAVSYYTVYIYITLFFTNESHMYRYFKLLTE